MENNFNVSGESPPPCPYKSNLRTCTAHASREIRDIQTSTSEHVNIMQPVNCVHYYLMFVGLEQDVVTGSRGEGGGATRCQSVSGSVDDRRTPPLLQLASRPRFLSAGFPEDGQLEKRYVITQATI